jgi:hypothetical protein
VLDVSMNLLDGPLPGCLVNSLKQLYVAGDSLSGTLPAFKASSKLRTLYANQQRGAGFTGAARVRMCVRARVCMLARLQLPVRALRPPPVPRVLLLPARGARRHAPWAGHTHTHTRPPPPPQAPSRPRWRPRLRCGTSTSAATASQVRVRWV